MNRDDDFIRTRLAELREAMNGLEPPSEMEHKVVVAFREHARGPRPRGVLAWRWALATVSATMIVGILGWMRAGEAPRPPAPLTARMEPPPIFAPARKVAGPVPARKSTRVRTAPVRTRPAVTERQEFATDFLPLPFAPPVLPETGGQVVRVSLPRSAMRSVGLPVSEERLSERVPADVFLGEDGFARAVRFVKIRR